MRPQDNAGKRPVFTSYQKFVVGLLAFLQFSVVVDFMLLSPLGAFLMPTLGISARQFGLVVSAYAFSACISGILAAGFADRFDRKRLLLFFYAGFVLGTVLCGVAPNYSFLLGARIVTGLFGGVIGSISSAIVADIFPLSSRGRVMGTVQSAFSASQVMGIPIGLFLANHFGWHAPFLMVAGIATAVGVVIVLRLKPITAHLEASRGRHPVRHLIRTATNRRYLIGFSATMLVATGGFMLQPFASNFSVHNLGVPLQKLPMVYMITGLTSMAAGPLLGRLSDRVGKYRMLAIATICGCVMVGWYTGLGLTPLWLVIVANCLLFVTITGRQVTTMALISAVPALPDRGAYMSVSSSMQQFAGGVSSFCAGLIVVQTSSGRLEHYHVLGAVVASAMLLTLAMMWNVNRLVHPRKRATQEMTAALEAGGVVP
jgi:predicted MFS family arabinose efflux permease